MAALIERTVEIGSCKALRTYLGLGAHPSRQRARRRPVAERIAMERRRPGFFLPWRALSRLLRRLFLEGIAALHAAGRLAFFGDLAPLANCRLPASRAGSYRRDAWFGADAAVPFVRLFSQAPAVAPARKVTTKLSIVNVSIIGKKRTGEEKVPGL